MPRRVASIPFVALHACYSWLVGISGETVSFNYTVFGEGEIEKVRFPPVSTSVIRRAFFGKTTPLFPGRRLGGILVLSLASASNKPTEAGERGSFLLSPAVMGRVGWRY